MPRGRYLVTVGERSYAVEVTERDGVLTVTLDGGGPRPSAGGAGVGGPDGEGGDPVGRHGAAAGRDRGHQRRLSGAAVGAARNRRAFHLEGRRQPRAPGRDDRTRVRARRPGDYQRW